MRFLVLAGTSDGRSLAEKLVHRGHDVVLSVLTPYGAELALGSQQGQRGLTVRHGAFSVDELVETLKHSQFDALIDASHPYASQLRETAKRASLESGLPYFRWVRPSSSHGMNGVYWAADISEAAELAGGLGERILLTTGSKNLKEWLSQERLYGKTLFARVLPTSQVLATCESLGLKPWQIIAAQGPFSQAWNEAVLKQLDIDVMVGKDSGAEGGTPGKISACQTLGIPLILLERPDGVQPELNLIEFIQRMEEELWTPKLFS